MSPSSSRVGCSGVPKAAQSRARRIRRSRMVGRGAVCGPSSWTRRADERRKEGSVWAERTCAGAMLCRPLPLQRSQKLAVPPEAIDGFLFALAVIPGPSSLPFALAVRALVVPRQAKILPGRSHGCYPSQELLLLTTTRPAVVANRTLKALDRPPFIRSAVSSNGAISVDCDAYAKLDSPLQRRFVRNVFERNTVRTGALEHKGEAQ